MILNWNDYPNFSRVEFVCPCGCDRADMQPEHMRNLQQVRTALGFPMRVSSGFRCVPYDLQWKGKGEHTYGLATDFQISGPRWIELVIAAHRFNFRRFGVKQHGPHAGRFIHLGSADFAPYFPAGWTYQ